MSLRKLLRKDSNYKKFQNILQAVEGLAEFDNYCNELEMMHKGRKSRNLVYKKISTKRLMDALMQDASYRSRCVEILVQVNKAQRMLQAATEAIRNHIIVKYKVYLSEYRTKAERENFVESILQDAYTKKSDMERISDVAKSIIEDIDKFSWTAKSIIEAMKLVFQKENVIGLKTHTV